MKLSRIYATLSPVIGLIVLVAVLAAYSAHDAKGSSYPGLPASIATTSPAAVSTSQSLIFGTTSPNCSSRIITTLSSAIMLTFSDKPGVTPSATVGHLQAASTTQVYDSGLYGCDAVRAYSFSSQTITVSEAR